MVKFFTYSIASIHQQSTDMESGSRKNRYFNSTEDVVFLTNASKYILTNIAKILPFIYF